MTSPHELSFDRRTYGKKRAHLDSEVNLPFFAHKPSCHSAGEIPLIDNSYHWLLQGQFLFLPWFFWGGNTVSTKFREYPGYHWLLRGPLSSHGFSGETALEAHARPRTAESLGGCFWARREAYVDMNVLPKAVGGVPSFLSTFKHPSIG